MLIVGYAAMDFASCFLSAVPLPLSTPLTSIDLTLITIQSTLSYLLRSQIQACEKDHSLQPICSRVSIVVFVLHKTPSNVRYNWCSIN